MKELGHACNQEIWEQGGCLEYEHFYKRFMYDMQKKGCAGENFGEFSPRYF